MSHQPRQQRHNNDFDLEKLVQSVVKKFNDSPARQLYDPPSWRKVLVENPREQDAMKLANAARRSSYTWILITASLLMVAGMSTLLRNLTAKPSPPPNVEHEDVD